MSKKIFMAATEYEERQAKFPALVQPKHNGIRCLWNGVTALTKNGNKHKPHIQKLLQGAHRFKWILQDRWVLDGELVLPRGKFSFQKAQSAIKKEGPNSHLIQFPVFDCHNMLDRPGAVFSSRTKNVDTPCYPVDSHEEVCHWHDVFVEQGYEGLIFRRDVAYRFGSGGDALMKKKYPIDSEFRIVEVWEGTKKNKGTPVYRCQRPDVPEIIIGRTPVTVKNSFGVTPEGDYDHKRELWKDRADAIGKPLTVRYWDLYESGVPQFPIGVAIRDYE